MLAGVRGAYRLTRALTTIRIPATVRAVLAARIDRLPPSQKRLLETAAVIGRDLDLPVLRAISEDPDEIFRSSLTSLQSAELLYETHAFPEPAYTFKHALTHEVAYQSLVHERRRALHARIVEAIERLDADRLAEQIERLARHAFLGESWAKALGYIADPPGGGRALRAGAAGAHASAGESRARRAGGRPASAPGQQSGPHRRGALDDRPPP